MLGSNPRPLSLVAQNSPAPRARRASSPWARSRRRKRYRALYTVFEIALRSHVQNAKTIVDLKRKGMFRWLSVCASRPRRPQHHRHIHLSFNNSASIFRHSVQLFTSPSIRYVCRSIVCSACRPPVPASFPDSLAIPSMAYAIHG